MHWPIEIDSEPTHVVFGWGALGRLADQVAQMGDRAVILTGRSYSGQHERIEYLVSTLRRRGIPSAVENRIQPNPDIEEIRELAPLVGEGAVIVAIGGGSVIDAGKVLAVAAAAKDNTQLDAWITGKSVDRGIARRKLVAVPTTAGTGSELSFGAIVSDRLRGWKGAVRGAGLAPEVAIVDPELTLTLGPQLTAATGFDVITHAFESFVSKRADARSRALSLVALWNMATHLPRVLANPSDRVSRTIVSFSSMLMGLNLRSVGTCLPHRMQYPVGGMVPHVSHPESLAWLYPPWITRVYAVRGSDVGDFLEILGVGRPNSGDDAGTRMKAWLEGIGLATRPPADVCLDPAVLIEKIEGNLEADPIPEPRKAALEIYKELW